MAAYDPTLATAVSRVRLEIGDAGANQKLTDDFISGVLSVVDDDVLCAAEKIAHHFWAKYGHEEDKSLGGPGSVRTKSDAQQRADQWKKIYDEIRSRRVKNTSYPEALGSRAEIEATLADTTLPQPEFFRGQLDNPSAVTSTGFERSWEWN